MVTCEIIHEFEAYINDIKFDNRNVYCATIYILECIDEKFGEVYNDRFIKELAAGIKRASYKIDNFSFAELETDLSNDIDKDEYEEFEDLQFSVSYVKSYINNDIKTGHFTRKLHTCAYCERQLEDGEEYYVIGDNNVARIVCSDFDNVFCSKNCIYEDIMVESRYVNE